MTSIRGCSRGLAALALLLIPALPVEAQPFSCSANSATPPLLRAEGHTELVTDMLLTCSGGTPTPLGQPVPQYNLQIFLNTNVTSRLLTGPWSEALLTIDEPQPTTQLVCGAPTAPAAPAGVCPITGSGTGMGLYDGTPGHPNVFQGQSAGSNSILFASIPVDPPAPALVRVLRLTNVRADTFALGFSPIGSVPPAVTMTIASTLPVSQFPNASIVGFSFSGVQFSAPAPAILQQCVSQNASLAADPTSNGSPQFLLNFSEGFLFEEAFKARTAAPVANVDQPPPLKDQNQPGGVPNTANETGFFNHLFPDIAGQGNLGIAGLANQGTRLMARFIGVPAGIQLFTNTTIKLTGGTGFLGKPVIRLVETDAVGGGPFSATPGNSFGIAPLSGSGPTRTAVFEVIRNDPEFVEQASIPIYVAYDANAPSTPGMGTVLVGGGFAPLTTDDQASATDPVPRFAPPTTALGAFTIVSCQNQCGVDVSAQTAVARGPISFSQALKLWVQFVSIQNTTANAIQGPLSLALDNISSTAAVANPTGFTRCDAPARHPYLNVNTGAGSVLNPGQTAVVGLAFSAANAQAIGYTTRVLAGPGNR